MIDLTRQRKLLKLLTILDRARAFRPGRDAGRRTADRNLAAFYREAWQQAAAAVGAEWIDLGSGVSEIRRGSFRTRVAQNTTPVDDAATHCIARTKPVVYRLLAEQGLPIPRYAEFGYDDLRPAVAFLDTEDAECVVKPASGTGGGAGVTTGIRTRNQLARAAMHAAPFGGDLLIEEQVEGDNYRLLYLDGKLLDVVARQSPAVVGDGRSTLRELIQRANEERARQGSSHVLISLDQDLQRTLARRGLTLGSVPSAGECVPIKTAINENSGDENVGAKVCAEIAEAGASAARAAGVRLAGVDVITRDASRPLDETGGVILEVNCPPGFYWHYRKRDGAFPVAEHVLRYLLDRAHVERARAA